MKNIYKIMCLMALMALCSCGTVKKSFFDYSKVKTYGQFTERLNLNVNPLVCDVEVKGKVTGTYVGSEVDKRDFVMGMAERDALKKAKADVLISPDYEVSFDGTVYTATVTAYAGMYKNFRNKVEEQGVKPEFVAVPVCPACGSMGRCMVEPQKGKCNKAKSRDNK